MCGIAGFSGFRNDELLRAMTEILKHRGPDDFGYHIEDDVSLGVRRLSIIDIEGGHQPIYNEDKSVCVVQNGEIYNYIELARTLGGKGHTFRTHSDTEVILRAYEHYGSDFCRHLNGDFAVAVHDRRKESLLLCRDRFGVHPLYYTFVNGNILFSSELKSLLLHPGVDRGVRPASLDAYLTLRYTPKGETLFTNIRKLKPGSILTIQNGSVKSEVYWSLPVSTDANPRRSWSDLTEELGFLMEDSVRIRMRSDVPVGAYLSGGLDSSYIVGLMAKYAGPAVKTFCIGFGTDVDETEQAAEIAAAFKTDHHEIILNKTDYQMLETISWHLDEPIGDSIVIPTFRLAREAARHVKVVLSGEGADEIWGGYIHHVALHNAGILKCFPGFTLKGLSWFLRNLPSVFLNVIFPYPAALGSTGRSIIADYFNILSSSTLSQEYLHLASAFRQPDKEKYYHKDFLSAVSASIPVNIKEEKTRLGSIISFDAANWLPDYTLLKQDKLSFANSLEVRVPFLDHRIAEFASMLPPKFKIRLMQAKRLLRSSAEKVIPSKRARASKKAFYFPVEKVFNAGFDDYVRDILGSSACRSRGIFTKEYLDTCIGQVRTQELIHNKQIFAILMLELWFRNFVDRAGDVNPGAVN